MFDLNTGFGIFIIIVSLFISFLCVIDAGFSNMKSKINSMCLGPPHTVCTAHVDKNIRVCFERLCQFSLIYRSHKMYDYRTKDIITTIEPHFRDISAICSSPGISSSFLSIFTQPSFFLQH